MNNDLWLIHECKNGNRDAYEKLFDRYHHKVFYTALHLVRDKALAEDITQEVFISIFQKINELRNPSAFRTWLYRIVISKTSYLLKSSGGAKLNLPIEYIDEEINEPDNCMSELVKQSEAKDLRSAIQCLSDELRLPILLYYFSELSTKEVAKVLNIPTGTVKSRLYTARTKLAEALKSSYSDCTGIIKEAGI